MHNLNAPHKSSYEVLEMKSHAVACRNPCMRRLIYSGRKNGVKSKKENNAQIVVEMRGKSARMVPCKEGQLYPCKKKTME